MYIFTLLTGSFIQYYLGTCVIILQHNGAISGTNAELCTALLSKMSNPLWTSYTKFIHIPNMFSDLNFKKKLFA